MFSKDNAAGANENPTDFVQSLARGLEVLELMGQLKGSATISDVSEHTGLNRATARRLLLTLERSGYLAHRGNQYALTPRVMQLGFSYLSNLGVAELVATKLDDLALQLGEAASLAVLDGDEIVYVARAKINKVMTVALNVGARLPAWNTSLGRVLLAGKSDAELAESIQTAAPFTFRTPYTKVSHSELMDEIQTVRSINYSLVDQELELGLRSLAVPVLRDGRTVAALNMATAKVSESPDETVARSLPKLRQVADEISKTLQAAPANILI